MLPYQSVAMDFAVTSGFQRHPSSHQPTLGLGVNINPAFTHSWFVPADLCVPFKQTPLLETGHVELFYMFSNPLHVLLITLIALAYLLPSFTGWFLLLLFIENICFWSKDNKSYWCVQKFNQPNVLYFYLKLSLTDLTLKI